MRSLNQMVRGILFSICVLLSAAGYSKGAATSAKSLPENTFANGVVVCEHKIAAKVGADILKKGGNAVDAAVATSYALAVVYPSSGNIGGGGFMLIRTADGNAAGIDYREKAPSGVFRDMYLDKDGNVVTSLTRDGALSVGVPGTVAGTLYALEKYGTMSRHDVLAPAIELAEKGFVLDYQMAAPYNESRKILEMFPETKALFKKPDGSRYNPGELFVQKELAKTLKAISEKGRDGFYKGWVAELLVKTMKKHNGIITHKDLEDYKAVERAPVSGTYRGYGIVSMPPSSSGGIGVIEMLNILERYDIAASGWNTAETTHLVAEAAKRVYADRAKYIADPDFIKVPTKKLISKKYAEVRAKDIDPMKATPSEQITHGNAAEFSIAGGETTHCSVVDKNGMATSFSTSLCRFYGSYLAVEGAGFLPNNQMQDFSAKVGVPNKSGFAYGEENAIEPNKRMVSSMAPTIVTKDGKNFMVLGSPGGTAIITAITQCIMNVIDHKMELRGAVESPRYHHQWLPDIIYSEKNRDVFSEETAAKLKKLGHAMGTKKSLGNIQAVLIETQTGLFTGVCDNRRKPAGMACGY